MPRLAEIGRTLRNVLDDLLDQHPEFLNLVKGGKVAEGLADREELDSLRSRVAEACALRRRMWDLAGTRCGDLRS